MYTDKELKEATQIAYLSFIRKAKQSLSMQDIKEPYTITQLIAEVIDTDNALKKAIKAGMDPKKLTIQDLAKFSDLSKFDKEIIEKLTPEMFYWKIKDVHDKNNRNGFYAVLIETSDNDAILAIRGSENSKNIHNLKTDWLDNDFGLLKNEKGTPQQFEAERYVEYLQSKGIIDQYSNLAVTGHSLGGNLASHVGIISSKKGHEKFASKLTQVINFDGPGFSKNYIRYHSNEIENSTKNIKQFKHYKWSAVGDLLYDMPGEQSDYLPINQDLHKNNILDRLKYKLIRRHHTESIMFDENGNAITGGKIDPIAKVLSTISKTAEDIIPDELAYDVYLGTQWMINHLLDIDKDGTYTLKNPIKIAGEAIGKVSQGILSFIKGIGNLYVGACNTIENKDNSFSSAAKGLDSSIINLKEYMNKNNNLYIGNNLEIC